MDTFVLDRSEAETVATGLHQVRYGQRYPLQSSLESECERLAWLFGDDARWEIRCAPARSGGWAAIAVVLGPCTLRDASLAELEHGQIYRVFATDPDECWTQSEAEAALLALLRSAT